MNDSDHCKTLDAAFKSVTRKYTRVSKLIQQLNDKPPKCKHKQAAKKAELNKKLDKYYNAAGILLDEYTKGVTKMCMELDSRIAKRTKSK